MLRRLSAPAAIMALLGLILVTTPGTAAFVADQRARFPVVLGGQRIEFGSPTVADLDGDSDLEILAGGRDGVLYAVGQDGTLLWSFNVGAAINAAARQVPGLLPASNPVPIRSAPAVADITGDGVPEIVVAAGDAFGFPTFGRPIHGGVIAMSAAGKALAGWPRLSVDASSAGNGPPDGYADGVVSSPAIGDITGDGRPEIIYGGFDQRVYARRADGSLLPGWPQFVLDTVWSSPALADLDADRVLDVIIGVDAHLYNGPPRSSQDGGDLYAFKGNGTILWRAHQDEIFESSPAVANLDADGRPEVVTGSGTFRSSKTGQPFGRYVSAWNHDGSLLWRTPLPERVPGSPALGDLNCDGDLEVVVGALNGYVYALDGATGRILWDELARDIFNNLYLPNPQVGSPVLGDYNGDGLDDVFIAIGWDVAVMSGKTGALLTATSPHDAARRSFYGAYTIMGTPALGDLDGNGKLDLVSASGNLPANEPGNAQVNSWELADSTALTGWPMFRGSPQHWGQSTVRAIKISDGRITEGQTGTTNATFTLTLSQASSQEIRVTYTTADGTAKAGRDYASRTGTVSFPAGTTAKRIAVPIIGDTLDEVNEAFAVNLTSPVNATIPDARGIGVIVDDDATPSLTISNVTVQEADSRAVNAIFTIRLSAASGRTVKITYATANGTAIAGKDYTSRTGTVSFAPGATTRQVAIAVTGDNLRETTESFTVRLTTPVAATIADNVGVGQITNDD